MRRLALLTIVLGACSGSSNLSLPAAGLIAPRALLPSSPPGTLVLGAAASSVTVARAPSATFTVERNAEYQIDLGGAAPADPHVFLFRDGTFVASDADGGEGTEARIVRFLEPGEYEIRATEWHRQAYEATARVTVLAGLAPAGEIVPGGEPLVVEVPSGETDRESAAEVGLVVAAEAAITIDAAATECDAQMILIEGGSKLGRDSDGGEDSNARIPRTLAAGRYTIRVYDWVHRACPISVSATLDPT